MHTIFDNVTNGIAGGAVTSPLWMPYVQTISDVAAVVTPILGGIWLAGRIIVSLYKAIQNNKKKNKRPHGKNETDT